MKFSKYWVLKQTALKTSRIEVCYHLIQYYDFLTSKIFLTLVELRNDIEAAIMALTCCEKNIKFIKILYI